ncbi:MAG: GGDEF domain-containing protein, partial [Burkholderiales bacterium]|nr:GGDEF domain-containing protein [Burkholderiales bacterium]
GPAQLLIVDIDHFKRINDTHGHAAGDAVLCQVADRLRAAVRQGDLVCRMGGEEFVVICLDTEDAGATRLAERLRAAVESMAVPVGGRQETIRCTVTIGVSQTFAGGEALDRALQQADAALYRGKAAGRNRVEPCDEAATALHRGVAAV